MMSVYTGTPGSGKSLNVARKIFMSLKIVKKPIIANFPIHVDKISKNGKYDIANFTFQYKLNVDFLLDYYKKNHVKNKESQTLVIIDEAQLVFNPRDMPPKERKAWVNFLTHHRKFGYDIILVTQFDQLLDTQIRRLCEYEVMHRKCNNVGLMCFFPLGLFATVTLWYPIKTSRYAKISSDFFIYRKRLGEIYDSFYLFDFEEEEPEVIESEDIVVAKPIKRGKKWRTVSEDTVATWSVSESANSSEPNTMQN